MLAGEIGPTTARNDGGNIIRSLGRGDQCCGRSRACTKIADGQPLCVRVLRDPVCDTSEAVRQQLDFETKVSGRCIDPLFFLGEQVEQQGAEIREVKLPRNETIAAATSTAAAAMCENHQAVRIRRQTEIPVETDVADGDLYAFDADAVCGGFHVHKTAPSAFRHHAQCATPLLQ